MLAFKMLPARQRNFAMWLLALALNPLAFAILFVHVFVHYVCVCVCVNVYTLRIRSGVAVH